MSAIDDGGPAFATPYVGDDEGMVDGPGSRGMSLRDWFAGQAMAALILRCGVLSCRKWKDMNEEDREVHEAADDADVPDTNHTGQAIMAYEFSDAMLAARKTGGAA